MQKRSVVLTGFMGTGKSTVGRLLAAQLDYRFVDTDALIMVQNGRSVSTIFQEEGEAAFRAMETAVSLQLSQEVGLVIATGGRLMLDPANATLLSNAHIFCLTASVETILSRVDDDGKRPLLNVADPAQRIRHLLAEREAGYGRFPQIKTDHKTAAQISKEIHQCIFATSKTAPQKS